MAEKFKKGYKVTVYDQWDRREVDAVIIYSFKSKYGYGDEGEYFIYHTEDGNESGWHQEKNIKLKEK